MQNEAFLFSKERIRYDGRRETTWFIKGHGTQTFIDNGMPHSGGAMASPCVDQSSGEVQVGKEAPEGAGGDSGGSEDPPEEPEPSLSRRWRREKARIDKVNRRAGRRFVPTEKELLKYLLTKVWGGGA